MKSLNAQQVKQLAKELKIKNWWTKKRADLVAEIVELKGWSNEKPEVIEYLMAGGEIHRERDQQNPNLKVTRQDQALQKRNRRKPRKVSEKAPKAEKTESDLVTLADICEELGLQGRIARRLLRNSDFSKPGKSWSWSKDSEEIELIKTFLGK